MTPQDPETLAERVARLERLVADLQRQLAQRDASPSVASSSSDTTATQARPIASSGPIPAAAAPSDEARRKAPRAPILPRVLGDSQFWLNRLGIGLVLIGVALLFRYSIEFTPTVRVLFGAALGVVLLVAGLRMGENRRFAAVLVGGALADFYIVGFAAFNLYQLIGYAPAFVGMVAITVAAYALALKRDEPALAILGAIGGLGTPLILGITYGTPRGFALYTCLILAWTAAVYWLRGWRWLLWTALAGGWLLLSLYARKLSPDLRGMPLDRWTLQAAAVFTWLSVGVLPVVKRIVTHLGAPEAHERRWREWEAVHWYALLLLPPHLALGVSALVWRPEPESWGFATLAVAAAYGFVAYALYRRDVRLSRALVLTAAMLASAGLVAALGGDSLLLAVAAQALALHWVAERGGGRPARWMAHKVFIAAAAWMLFRLVESGDTSARRVFADLAVLVCGFVISYLVHARRERLAYRYFVHVGLLGWLWRELAPLDGGQGLATIAWGAYGLALMLTGMRRGWPLLEKTAIATLLVVVAKLFLVDLAALEALFRVVLFLGFGSVFLLLSYLLQDWWKGERSRGTSGEAG